MPFDAIGRWTGRPNQPPGWRLVPGTSSHHMIDWAVLCAFWNRLVESRQQAAALAAPIPAQIRTWETTITRYLQLTSFEGDPQQVLTEIRGGHMQDLSARNLGLHDNLATALCWQRYNLFEGPPPGQHAGRYYRPSHSPDPAEILRHFAELGPAFFDFPIVGPPHGRRAMTLFRAYEQMHNFIATGGANSAEASLQLLETVCGLDIIPAHDVNWFALPKQQFLTLSPQQRQQFFQACYRHGWQADGPQIYAQLFRA